ncbi:MAG TPA: glutathione S-transferase family protein [Geminicoccaceae bacterium]|nr:glutathione S-transferase family protein [Geminicoccaceae bacterium]
MAIAEFTLIVGNKNYSSWSLRGWLAARLAGIAFDEQLVRLSEPGSRRALLEHSPAGKVPILKHGRRVIWDSLAIIEYLAEQRPAAGLWPADAEVRALARSVAAEMHSGFGALRSHMPMNLRKSLPGRGRGPGVTDDIARIDALWQDCRSRFGSGGPFLFGAAGAADAMYAPVATRFRTYGVTLDPVAAAYVEAVHDWPAFREWQAAALAEPWIIPEDEVE